MSNFRGLILVFISFCFWGAFSQNKNYSGYFTNEGDTVKAIAKKYGTTILSIRSLNPDIDTDNLKPGELLIIPPSSTLDKTLIKTSEINSEVTIKHEVQASETLYKISRQYHATPQAIQELNPNIDINRLSIGQLIIVPYIDYVKIYSQKKSHTKPRHKLTKIDLEKSIKELPIDLRHKIYFVGKGDTPYSVAKKYKLKFKNLAKFNPILGRDFHPGDVVFLTKDVEKNIRDLMLSHQNKDYDYKPHVVYNVHSKETLYSISKKFNVTVQEIYDVNPGLHQTGLKSNSLIKVPTPQESTVYKMLPEKRIVTFDSIITSKDTVRIALALPLKLYKQRQKMRPFETSNIGNFHKEILRDKLLDYSLDFYMGTITAIDSLKKKGAHIKLKLLDTEDSDLSVLKLMSRRAFDNIDVVIGPFYAKSFNLLSEYLEKRNIPIVSPFTSQGILQRTNTIVSLPPKTLLKQRFINYVKNRYLNAKIFLATDSDRLSEMTFFRKKFPNIQHLPMDEEQMSIKIDTLKHVFSFIWKPKPKDSLEQDKRKEDQKYYDLSNKDFNSIPRDSLDYSGKDNIVFVEVKNPLKLVGLVSVLNTFVSDTCKVRMVTTDKNKAYDNKSLLNTYLNNLNFSYPSVNSPLMNFDTSYAINYKNTYGNYPNRYASRGFDLTIDIVSRIYRDGDKWISELNKYKTRQLENLFDYKKHSKGEGFYNKGAFVMKYEDMFLKEE